MGDRGSGRPTWAEIDLGAVETNLATLRTRAPGRRVIAVVKANAYGHGARLVAVALVSAGADALAVATTAEAAELRAGRIAVPILLLEGLHATDEADYALEIGCSVALTRMELVPALEAAAARAGRAFPLHLKFDTGMTRLGLAPEEVDAVLDRVLASKDLDVQGVMSHLAEADDPSSPHTGRQRERFAAVVARMRDRGVEPRWIHLDNSPAVLHGPTDRTTAIRPGLALYGADPTLDGGHELVPVMALCTRILQIRSVPAGARVGYGGTYVTPRATHVATLPIGYADGLPRAAADGGYAPAVGERRVPLAGRVSMDLASIDLGPEPGAEVDDVVLLFGQRHGMRLPVEELARASGTIPYEILTRVGDRVPRVAVRRPDASG